MTTNYDKAINRIKEENGGVLPSGLYLQTNEQLSKLIHDLSGKFAPPRTSKKVLVARIEKLTQASQASSTTTLKRKADDITPGLTPAPAPPKKVPRGCLPQLTAVQICEMKRTRTAELTHYTHRELYPMWLRMGVTSQYPRRSSKELVVTKMKEFSERNLAFHAIP